MPAAFATSGALLVQIPPPTLLLKVTEPPIQTWDVDGVIAAGVTLTVIVFTEEQPAALV